MKPKQYWVDRMVELEKRQNKKAKATYSEIESSFDKAKREIKEQIDKWFGRIATNNEMSLADAQKLLSKDELEEFHWDVEEYIQHAEENATDPKWTKQLENSSAKYHISRLAALQLQVQQAFEVAFGNEGQSVGEMCEAVYLDNYYRTAFEVQKANAVGWKLGGIDERQLKKIISKPWAADGKDFSSRIWGSKDQMVVDLQQELLRTCLTGDSPDAAIKHMTQFVDSQVKSAKRSAARVVQTEQAYIASASQKDCFNDLGVEEFEIVGTLDTTTCESCGGLDGKHLPMSEFKEGVTAPPFHPFCRCTTVPYFNDEWSSDGERAARGKDGKTYYVPADMTYTEWKKQFTGKEAGKEIDNEPFVSYAESKDREQYDRYKNVLGELAPNSFEEFQEIKYNSEDGYNTLKHQYRALNAYEDNFGEMDKLKKVELYDKTLETKKQFTGDARRKSNTAVMELDGEIKIANSGLDNATDSAYKNFKGDKSQIVFKPDDPQFTAKVVGSHMRDIDSEKKLLEYAATIAEDGKKHTINLFSERCMCESCRDVVEQFKKKYPNVEVSVVSGKEERVRRNKNNPMRYLR